MSNRDFGYVRRSIGRGPVGPRRHLRAAVAVLIGLCVTLVVCMSSAEAQRSKTGEFETRIGHGILMEGDTGAILYQKDADVPVAPGAMTKLMTLEIVFKLLKAGKLKASDEFVMSTHAWRSGGWGSGMQAMMVPLKRRVSLADLILGIAVFNANDAAICIAEGIAGSEDKFAKLMTEEARKIGLEKSEFRNPTGYDAAGHLMSIKDIAALARHIIDTYPEQFRAFAQKEFRYRQPLRNLNPMLSEAGVDGMLTSDLARRPKGPMFGLVSTAKRGGRRLIAVVHGADSAARRKAEASRLIEWGYKNIREFKLFDAQDTVGMARVWGGSVFYLPLVGSGGVSVWLPRYPATQRLRGEIVYNGPLKAPIKKGQEVARLRVTSSANATQDVPLYAAQDVEQGGLVWRGLDSLAHLALRVLPY